MKYLLPFLLLAPTALSAAEIECSRCGSYGSPFGPDDGYRYYCYYLSSGERAWSARAFESMEACQQGRLSNPICEPVPNRAGPRALKDPCWKI